MTATDPLLDDPSGPHTAPTLRERDPLDLAHLHEDADFAWAATPEFCPVRADRVASVEVDGDLVLTHAEAPTAVHLDPVTTLLWRSFSPGTSVEALAEDVSVALDLDLDATLDTMTGVATNLGRMGFLTEPARPPILRRTRFYEIPVDSCAGKKIGLARVDLEGAVTFDLGPQLLTVAATDPTVVDWLRVAFAGSIAAADDPRRDDATTERVIANFGAPAAHRRSRHRLFDHFGNLWFSTFDKTEAANALARVVQDRLDAARGGTWIRVPVLVPTGAGPGADPEGATPALLLHPWLGLSLDRLIPGLRHAGVAVHPSPLVRYDAMTGRIDLAPSPRRPGPDTAPHPPAHLAPVALVAVWPDLPPAEIVEKFAPAALAADQAHLDAVADLVARVPYARLDSSQGLRSTAAQLASLLSP